MHGRNIAVLIVTWALQACGGTDQPEVDLPPGPPVVVNQPDPGQTLDEELRARILELGLTGDPSTGRDLPSINSPLAQLGKQLFFTKALGGDFDAACVSCHHPTLGGSDALSLSVGVGAINPDHLGIGRRSTDGVPNVPRNAPTTFNAGLWDTAMFMDSRVASLGEETGQNGAASGISTPDTASGVIDAGAGPNLVTAQARFPVTSHEEMRGSLEIGADNDSVREHLAGRLGNYGAGAGELLNSEWLIAFQMAFQSSATAEALVTYDNIALALAEYQRSQVFVDNPWRTYVQGNDAAISDDAKRGALLFLTVANAGGAGCVECHSGDFFSDGAHHAIAAPQFGSGKGNPNNNDFGRANISGNATDRFRFRTPSLLNIAVTGPYMHTGAYETLNQVVQHYDDVDDEVDEFFDDGGWCQLEQFEGVANCADLYPNASQNSAQAVAKVRQERAENDPAALPNVNINNNERGQIVDFLNTLTDPCILDRACLAPWIAEPGAAADDHQLNAVDQNGLAL